MCSTSEQNEKSLVEHNFIQSLKRIINLLNHQHLGLLFYCVMKMKLVLLENIKRSITITIVKTIQNSNKHLLLYCIINRKHQN